MPNESNDGKTLQHLVTWLTTGKRQGDSTYLAQNQDTYERLTTNLRRLGYSELTIGLALGRTPVSMK